MGNSQHLCLNCGKPITWSFAICANCEKIFGNKSLQWPEWLRYLWNEEQRSRRRDKKVRTNEIPMSHLDESISDEE